ncbi:CAAX protease self-immunity [Austwickia chelonae]|nr:CPBP family intramembrane glutamic endopeptidase [Austwickia chelonae]SEW33949.1 CAAX protease self-immunity [Austwickia chelonae]
MSKNPRWKCLKDLGIYLAVYLVMTSVGEILIGTHVMSLFGVNNMRASTYDHAMNQLSDTAANLLTGLALVYAYRRRNPPEKRGPGLPGVLHRLQHMAVGLVLGAGAMSLLVGILVVLGVAKVTTVAPQITTLTLIPYFISVGYEEEVWVRGTVQHTLAKVMPLALVITLSSLLFGAIHLTNDNISLLGITNVVLAGVLFSVFTWTTKNLYMAIGFHITWNWFQGGFFGMTVSGHDFIGKAPFKVSMESGHDLLTGGAFGPEASLLTTVLFIGLSVAVWLFYRGRQTGTEQQLPTAPTAAE